MRLKMRTMYAGPNGTCDPDRIIDIANPKEARELVERGFAVPVDETGAEIALATKSKGETA